MNINDNDNNDNDLYLFDHKTYINHFTFFIVNNNSGRGDFH